MFEYDPVLETCTLVKTLDHKSVTAVAAWTTASLVERPVWYDIATQLPIEPVPFVSEPHHSPQNYAIKSCDFFGLTAQEKKTCSDFAGGFPVTADEVTITVYGAVGSMVCSTRKKIKIDDKSKAKVSLNRRPAA